MKRYFNYNEANEPGLNFSYSLSQMKIKDSDINSEVFLYLHEKRARDLRRIFISSIFLTVRDRIRGFVNLKMGFRTLIFKYIV